MKPYIQPFERRLALMELEAVARATPQPAPTLLDETPKYRVITCSPIEHLANTLTYWESVGDAASTITEYTQQARIEAAATIVRNGIQPYQIHEHLPFNGGPLPLPHRRVLRYGSHGIHEYRGKFFPQLVRSLLNIGQVRHGDIVLDPMCGSGTTLVEASLMGCVTFGVDMNPLSVLMSQTKCDILAVAPDRVEAEYEALTTDVRKPRHDSGSLTWVESLSERDRKYLSSWFSEKTLCDLDPIAVRVQSTTDPACRNLFRLCLSNILRRVSWQKEDDLRIRKEMRSDLSIDVVGQFLDEVRRTVCMVLAFLLEKPNSTLGPTHIFEGDARSLTSGTTPLSHLNSGVSAVVTSPPYATALPYLDTDRLSLSYLGLLSREEHRLRDYRMIGNREITGAQRHEHLRQYQDHKLSLPQEIVALIDRIQALNDSSEVGFRRRNLAALLARYFFDMREVFKGIAGLLKPGGVAYVVIGNNHTVAGGHRIDIETDRLLGLLGSSANLTLTDSIPMEMLVSRDIFKRNAVASESVLCFRN